MTPALLSGAEPLRVRLPVDTFDPSAKDYRSFLRPLFTHGPRAQIALGTATGPYQARRQRRRRTGWAAVRRYAGDLGLAVAFGASAAATLALLAIGVAVLAAGGREILAYLLGAGW